MKLNLLKQMDIQKEEGKTTTITNTSFIKFTYQSNTSTIHECETATLEHKNC